MAGRSLRRLNRSAICLPRTSHPARNEAALPGRPVPKSASATIRKVSPDISSSIENGSAERVLPSHSLHRSTAARVIRAAIAAIRCRWKAGCARRRCRNQKLPSLVNSPLPSRRRKSAYEGCSLV